MSDALINEPPRYPQIEGAEILEQVAKFLWEGVAPYDRGVNWDDHNQATKWHYRARAARFLETFEVTPRYGGRTPPIRDLTDPDSFKQVDRDVLAYGHAIVRITPSYDAGWGYMETFGV
jgi:hypothetical protein